MIKLVVCDYDGTLVGIDFKLPVYAYGTGQNLRKKGAQLTIATGRSASFIEDAVEVLKIESPVITSNGAVIKAREKYLIKKQFGFKEFGNVLDLANRLELSVSVTAESIDYINRQTEWFEREEKHSGKTYKSLSELPKNGMVEKISMVDSSFSGKLDEIEKICTNKNDFSYVRYGNQGFDIISKDVNKANGIRELSALLGINPEEILAIGDSENDIEILEYAGIGAVVGNASEAAKEKADYIAKNFYFDGVQEIIEKFC